MTYELISPSCPAEWAVYHDIRRVVLFENRGRVGVYDPQHPDEFKPNHFPKLLLFDKISVGVVRIDIDDEIARFRRVAIAGDQQRRGHGRKLLSLAEAFSIKHHARRVEASVAADAIEFYRRCGYQALRVLDAVGSVRMTKDLANG